MSNLEIYERLRKCPKEALKPITGGRLKGMSDINPMWRIKMLTDTFGTCGFGWYTKIVRTWIEDGKDGEKTANIEIELYVKMGGEWSMPIQGIGGSSLVVQERNGLYTDDECYKKAYTDAISVACKALGMAADVYFDKDTSSKYPTQPREDAPRATNIKPQTNTAPETVQTVKCTECGADVDPAMAARTQKAFGVTLCKECGIKRSQKAGGNNNNG